MYAFTVQSTIIYIRFLLDYWILLYTYHVHYVNYICHDLWFCSEQISFLYFTYSIEYIDKNKNKKIKNKISNTCFSITMDLLFPFTFSSYFFLKTRFLSNWISIIIIILNSSIDPLNFIQLFTLDSFRYKKFLILF